MKIIAGFGPTWLPSSRRVKGMQIPDDIERAIIFRGYHLTSKALDWLRFDDFPNDVEAVGAQWDATRMSTIVYLTHPKFPAIAEGAQIPLVRPELLSLDNDLALRTGLHSSHLIDVYKRLVGAIAARDAEREMEDLQAPAAGTDRGEVEVKLPNPIERINLIIGGKVTWPGPFPPPTSEKPIWVDAHDIGDEEVRLKDVSFGWLEGFGPVQDSEPTWEGAAVGKGISDDLAKPNWGDEVGGRARLDAHMEVPFNVAEIDRYARAVGTAIAEDTDPKPCSCGRGSECTCPLEGMASGSMFGE